MTNNPTDLFFRSSKKRKTVIRGTGKKRLLSFLGVGQDCCARSVGAKKKKKRKSCAVVGEAVCQETSVIRFAARERVSATIVFLQLDVPRLYHFDG